MLRKAALITGSTAGIGLGIARRLAEDGCSLVITGLGEKKYTDSLVDDLRRKYHKEIYFVDADLQDDQSVQNLCNTVMSIHKTGVDILVNNAGWGRVINMASMNGLSAQPGKIPYCTTKAGLIGMTRVIALESAEYGITCNAVCPGFVETEIAVKQIQSKAEKDNITYEEAKKLFFDGIHPTKKPVTIEQISGLVSFLCTDAADSMTGGAILMDAGNLAR